MTAEELSKERRILMAMRKTLASIVRDLTPKEPDQAYPLSTATVEDVKACFDLIAARERELAAAEGLTTQELPRFVDEPRNEQVISLKNLKTSKQRETQ
ncbi:MAG: segregation and condensation protein A [Thiothrix sp.]|nr:MAG: segregation and condensation protein A [Thiothrix sp.]